LPSGVEPKQLTVFQVTLRGERYASTRKTTEFVASVLDQLSHTPGVDRVAAVNGLPLDRGLNMGGYPAGHSELERTIEFRAVTPYYFETMGVSLLAGRDIADSDRADGDLVVVVGETTAKKWWPGRSPIGQYIRIGKEKNWRVVGVVADVRSRSLVEAQGVMVYAPMVQLTDEFTGVLNGWFPTTFAVRTAAHVSLAQVAQKAVAQADPEIPVAKLTTMQAVIDNTVQEPRFFSLLAGGFSGFALVLTVIGLFGLLSYQVTQRTREIGVRMALGADRTRILLTFLSRGLMLASVGVVVGGAASWLLKPVVSELLADAGIDASVHTANVILNGTQASVFAVTAILIATVAASWLPARRAASVEPMQALRTE
jgi:predicted permease